MLNCMYYIIAFHHIPNISVILNNDLYLILCILQVYVEHIHCLPMWNCLCLIRLAQKYLQRHEWQVSKKHLYREEASRVQYLIWKRIHQLTNNILALEKNEKILPEFSHLSDSVGGANKGYRKYDRLEILAFKYYYAIWSYRSLWFGCFFVFHFSPLDLLRQSHHELNSWLVRSCSRGMYFYTYDCICFTCSIIEFASFLQFL